MYKQVYSTVHWIDLYQWQTHYKNVLNTDAKNAFNSLPTTHEMWVKFVAVLHTADANAEPGLKGQNENKKVILTNGISHRKKEKLKNTGHIHRMSNYP